jgi:WD40 repeat protein
MGGKWVNARRLSDYHKGTIYSVDWSHAHGAIASGKTKALSKDLWTISDSRPLLELTRPPWFSSRFSVAAGADDCIRVFVEGDKGEGGDPVASTAYTCELTQAAAHGSDVNCVRWNPKLPNVLASAGDDHVVKVWRYNAA